MKDIPRLEPDCVPLAAGKHLGHEHALCVAEHFRSGQLQRSSRGEWRNRISSPYLLRGPYSRLLTRAFLLCPSERTRKQGDYPKNPCTDHDSYSCIVSLAPKKAEKVPQPLSQYARIDAERRRLSLAEGSVDSEASMKLVRHRH